MEVPYCIVKGKARLGSVCSFSYTSVLNSLNVSRLAEIKVQSSLIIIEARRNKGSFCYK
uniref:Uncharacterized protein n=1 Tax=Arundo donax TaxID=35708 RepID=A0A0A9G0M9_ARUDO